MKKITILLLSMIIITLIISCETELRMNRKYNKEAFATDMEGVDSSDVKLIFQYTMYSTFKGDTSFHQLTYNEILEKAKTVTELVAQLDDAEPTSLKAVSKPAFWSLNNFVDEFGQISEEKYIQQTKEGTFSNTATVGEYLYVELLISKNSAGIFLHKYKMSSPVEKFIGSGKILMRNKNDEKINITISGDWNHSGGVALRNESFNKFLNFINKSTGSIDVIIRDDYSSEYHFRIDTHGFKEGYRNL